MIHDLRYTNKAAYEKIKKAAFALTTDERAAEIYDLYTEFYNKKKLSDYLRENNLSRTEENIERYFEKYDGITRENVEEEITAKCIMNDARVNRLFDRLGDRSTWKKFCDVVSDFRKAIAERFSGKGEDDQLLVSQSKSIEKTILNALGADYAAERVMRTYGYDGKEAYGGKEESKNNINEGFVADKYYERQIDKWDSLSEGSYITVGEVRKDSPLNKVGIPASKLYFDVTRYPRRYSLRHTPHRRFRAWL